MRKIWKEQNVAKTTYKSKWEWKYDKMRYAMVGRIVGEKTEDDNVK